MQRIIRRTTAEERARHAAIRAAVEKEFPPLNPPREPSVSTRVSLAIAKARRIQGLTLEDVAARAGIEDPSLVQSIEFGDDAAMSDIASVMRVLGLSLEVVELHQ